MNLDLFFSQHKSAALAFSGGVDSAYLLHKAVSCDCDIHAYYVKSAFQPQFELEDAMKLAKELGVKMTILELDVLSDKLICSNPPDRCYHCKKKIFSAIAEAAKKDGYALLLDGTNATDDADDRPGMKALKEFSVRSPLRECGLSKSDIRRLSKEAGLFTWDKPAYACLATRIPAGQQITCQKLIATEKSESYLTELGFSDFRIRLSGTEAKIQLKEEQLEKLLYNRRNILETLKPFYTAITVDLEVRP